MSDNLKGFFDAVWGDDAGSRIIGTKKGKGAWKSAAYPTNDAAIQAVREAIQDDKDCYFGVHLFRGENREAADAIGARALYLDIDIKPGKPNHYTSQEEALVSLQSFVAKTGMPEPTIIGSGHGFHLYWFLDSFLTESVWNEAAQQLKTLCKSQGLKADAAVTADAAASPTSA